MARELKKIKSSENGEETEYELQFAWDRNATFLNAQSRAMGELRSLIKQYDTMVNANLELVTEEQKLRIDKLKGEVKKLSGDNKDNDITINYLKEKEFPFVVIGRPDEIDGVLWVDNDNFAAMYNLTQNMIELDNKRIAFIGAKSE